ncbi:MBL fold metallo-hydrolase [Butyrivibrio sp. AE3009]|uniref:MBL fold metallo-hydrolase n=1 Tax=Butyrivibrio sp. AE3009 TaxID=1280666 RepID=UPI0003B5C1AC|nr:MBL fold metallo-hydrolase [Butyrivibrio sp. AE3009]
MRIVNLIENTEGNNGCSCAHGLSFYIETGEHRLLMDFGPSEVTLSNAGVLGIDLAAVDVAILSHGHYDHSGGIIPFAELNSKAPIYMQRGATGDYYSEGSEGNRYIGIDKNIAKLPQVRFVEGDYIIDDELSLFVVDKRVRDIPFTNSRLKIKRENEFLQDDFSHEQALVIKSEGKTVLLSGCAHNGIINFMEAYKAKYGEEPDIAISGFHLVKKTEYSPEQMREITATAEALTAYRSQFYTCHCTGITAYEAMKNIMGGQLEYIHTGDAIEIL